MKFPLALAGTGCTLSDRYCASISNVPGLDDRLKSLATTVVKTWKEEIEDLSPISDSDVDEDPKIAGDEYRWGLFELGPQYVYSFFDKESNCLQT